MRREEAYVFKVFDSMKDGRARWTAHTAFEDPTSAATLGIFLGARTFCLPAARFEARNCAFQIC